MCMYRHASYEVLLQMWMGCETVYEPKHTRSIIEWRVGEDQNVGAEGFIAALCLDLGLAAAGHFAPCVPDIQACTLCFS